MNRYTVGGKIAAANVMGTSIAQLWNPSSTRRIEVVEFSVFDEDFDNTTAFSWLLSRSSARGATPNVTVTPDGDNAHQADSVPPSGAVLEFGPFATPPTLATPPLYVLAHKPIIGGTKPDGGIAYFPGEMGNPISEERPIVVGPGTGFVLHMTGSAVSMAASQEVTVGFED